MGLALLFHEPLKQRAGFWEAKPVGRVGGQAIMQACDLRLTAGGWQVPRFGLSGALVQDPALSPGRQPQPGDGTSGEAGVRFAARLWPVNAVGGVLRGRAVEPSRCSEF